MVPNMGEVMRGENGDLQCIMFEILEINERSTSIDTDIIETCIGAY